MFDIICYLFYQRLGKWGAKSAIKEALPCIFTFSHFDPNCEEASLAQWLARQTSNLKAASSSLARGAMLFASSADRFDYIWIKNTFLIFGAYFALGVVEEHNFGEAEIKKCCQIYGIWI